MLFQKQESDQGDYAKYTSDKAYSRATKMSKIFHLKLNKTSYRT